MDDSDNIQARNISHEQLSRNVGAEDAQPEMEYYKPYHADPFDDEDLDLDLEQPVVRNDPDWCYLCYCGQHTSDVENNENHSLLLQLITEQQQLTSVNQFTSFVQRFYDTNIRAHIELPASDRNYRPLIWRKRTIYAHMEKHSFNPEYMIQDCVMTFREILTTLRDGRIFMRSKLNPEEKSIERSGLNMYCSVYKFMNLAMKQLKRPTHVL
jgi:hypothetical protein